MSLRRALPTAAGGVLVVVLAALWLTGAHQVYDTFFAVTGVRNFQFPFLDTHAVLAAIECNRLGVDVYVANPCDVLGRPHVYSPLWLHLGAVPVSTRWTAPVGAILDVAFLASLMMLPAARHLPGSLAIAAAVVSPAVVFALERANNDLAIFVLAVLAGWSATRGPRIRVFGYAVIVLAAALKFYPATLMVLAWRERIWRCAAVATVSVIALAACLVPEMHDLARALRLVPHGAPFFGTFGAGNLSSGFMALFDWPDWAGVLLSATATAAMAFGAVRCCRELRPALMRLSEPERVFLTIGGALIVGCFLAGQSIEYRAVHLLFIFPALLALAAHGNGRVARVAVALSLGVMWIDPLRGMLVPRTASTDFVLWMAYQLAWWTIVALLAGSLLALLLDSVAVKSLSNQMVAYTRLRRPGASSVVSCPSPSSRQTASPPVAPGACRG